MQRLLFVLNLALSAGYLHATPNLDQPVRELGTEVLSMAQALAPEITKLTSVRDLLTLDFLVARAKRNDPRLAMLLLRTALARHGLPTGLSPMELELFERHPENPLFKPLTDFSFANPSNRKATTLSRNLTSNGFIFIFEFLRYYNAEMMNMRHRRFQGLRNLGLVSLQLTADSIYAEFEKAEGNWKCEAGLAGLPTEVAREGTALANQ